MRVLGRVHIPLVARFGHVLTSCAQLQQAHIKYDDGDSEDGVLKKFLRPIAQEPTRKKRKAE